MNRDYLIMFRFLSKLPSFFQAAKRFAVAAVKAFNVVVQVCDFTIGILQSPAYTGVSVEPVPAA